MFKTMNYRLVVLPWKQVALKSTKANKMYSDAQVRLDWFVQFLPYFTKR